MPVARGAQFKTAPGYGNWICAQAMTEGRGSGDSRRCWFGVRGLGVLGFGFRGLGV